MNKKTKKTKIAVFYDGYYFDLVSRYYKFGHQLHQWIDFDGLDAYLHAQTAAKIKIDEKDCTVIARHLYKGILTGRDVTPEQAKKDSDYRERLKKHNIIGHFRDLRTDEEGKKFEKMVDADLICDALEMAFKKEFDVLVLIASDSDFVPMVEKLNKWAIDSVLFWWDIPEYEVNGIKRHRQRTSGLLIRSVKHNVEMGLIADKRIQTELEHNIFSKIKSPTKENQHEQQLFQYNTDQLQMLTSDKVEHPSVGQPFMADKIETLVMGFNPRELTVEEQKKTWVSSVVSINQEGWGYVRGPVEFKDRTLNNFQFSTQDIGDRQITEFEKGMKVQFKLKPDPKRSERSGYPLYRAYDIILLDPPVSSTRFEQSEPIAELPKHEPEQSFPKKNDDPPALSVQSIPIPSPEPPKGPNGNITLEEIDLPKEEVDDHLVGVDDKKVKPRAEIFKHLSSSPIKKPSANPELPSIPLPKKIVVRPRPRLY